MRQINIKTIIGTAVIALFLMGCSSILDEQPRSIYVPGYFKTEAGVMSGLTSLYASNRYIFGNGYFYSHCETGTDEATYAQSADSNFKIYDFSNQGLLNSTVGSSLDVLWKNAFPTINTASGIIENAAEVGTISASMVAEAKFFRAFNYFMLVQTFGGVPLDLGSGRLKFNIQAIRTSVRDSVSIVYTKGIFPDLLEAVNDLPATGRVTGGATKTLARLYLAKAYLTYAWWLENPNNIPTYPVITGTRVDPAGHTASWYYQQAYNVSTAAIADPGSFGLQATYYDVNLGSNDRNNEVLLYADHTQAMELYNGSSLTYSGNTDADNAAGWMVTCNYTNIKSAPTAPFAGTAVNSVQREADQHLGRPWTRMCPTYNVFATTSATFPSADRTTDSRYDGTFVTVYHANWQKADYTAPAVAPEFLYNANSMKIYPGDAVLTFLDEEADTVINYSNSIYKSNIGAGVLPRRADYVIAPSGLNRIIYPGLWKLGPYRTDKGTGLGTSIVNAANTRPFNIAKFSELFFIAAEAAVKGATTQAVAGTYANDGTARGLINVIRARAGKWRFKNNANVAYTADNSAAMTAATPATIDINYILAERSREFYGEGYRWYDLVRTQKWAELAATYQVGGVNYTNHTLVTTTRTGLTTDYAGTKHLWLRPIPQSQLDGLDMTDAEKAAYQNPGY